MKKKILIIIPSCLLIVIVLVILLINGVSNSENNKQKEDFITVGDEFFEKEASRYYALRKTTKVLDCKVTKDNGSYIEREGLFNKGDNKAAGAYYFIRYYETDDQEVIDKALLNLDFQYSNLNLDYFNAALVDKHVEMRFVTSEPQTVTYTLQLDKTYDEMKTHLENEGWTCQATN